MAALKRQICLLLVLVLAVGTLLVGCTPSATDTTPAPGEATTAGDDAGEEPVTKTEEWPYAKIIWYTVGDQNADHEEVWGQFNRMLKEKMNTEVDLKFTTWTDWQTKYNVLLTSGEQIDGIFAANWANFYSYASSGAFMDLTDLVPTYAPQTWAQLTDQMWSECSVDGKIYAIGTNYKEYTPGGFLYREDWRKQLGCAPITDIDTAEAYFRAVKEKLGITPLNGTCNGIILRMNVWYGGDFYHIAGEESLIVKVKGYDTPRNVVCMVHDESFMTMAKRAAQWAKEGFWPADAINSQTGTDVTLKAGTGAAHQCNPAGARGIIQEQAIQGNPAEFAYFCYTDLTGIAVPNISSNNCFAVPKSAKYPERTIAATEYIRNDRDAYNTIFYGIEGKHYSVTSEGKLQVPAEGQDPTVVKGWDYANWNFRNPAMFIEPVVDWDQWEALNQYFEDQYKPNIHWPFYLNKDAISTELAAMAQVTAQYEDQIVYGMSDDPEKMVNDYRAALEDAGLQKVIDEVSRQLFAYYDSVGIK